MEKAKVYFSKTITSENVIEMYKKLNKELKENIAIKIHSGEKGNQNYLQASFFKPIVKYLNGTIVECNTAYEGARNTTEKHNELMKEHLWTKYFNVDILDSNGDLELEIPEGKIIKKNYVGKNIQNYDSMLVISHFKGHPMGGYGGALKQLSIGLASSYGKAYIHGAGKIEEIWTSEHDKFLESMADASYSITKYFNGEIAYINIMCNMSVDCDCCAHAEEPCMKDIGILSSLDPVALDKACIDLIYNSNDPGKNHLIERIESRNGIHTIDEAYKLNVGNKDYELIIVE